MGSCPLHCWWSSVPEGSAMRWPLRQSPRMQLRVCQIQQSAPAWACGVPRQGLPRRSLCWRLPQHRSPDVCASFDGGTRLSQLLLAQVEHHAQLGAYGSTAILGFALLPLAEEVSPRCRKRPWPLWHQRPPRDSLASLPQMPSATCLLHGSQRAPPCKGRGVVARVSLRHGRVRQSGVLNQDQPWLRRPSWAAVWPGSSSCRGVQRRCDGQRQHYRVARLRLHLRRSCRVSLRQGQLRKSTRCRASASACCGLPRDCVLAA
mmetsp:Transcript_64967/g.164591  ORF Transcript_64967/g.164591 Transcript_64967/m.164591 type:complete len:261 (+) Transcript_64967:60-842(+)